MEIVLGGGAVRFQVVLRSRDQLHKDEWASAEQLQEVAAVQARRHREVEAFEIPSEIAAGTPPIHAAGCIGF